MKLTKYEQETIINFNNDEQEASIYTASPQMMRKLDALAAAYPEHYQVVEQTEVSKTYSCEKHLINLRKPRKVNEEHSQWARQRMQEMNCHKMREIYERTAHRGDSSVSGRKLSVKIRKLRKIENQMAGERLWTWKRFRLFFYAIK